MGDEVLTQYTAPHIHWGSHPSLVSPHCRGRLAVAQGGGRSFVCFPAPGAVRGFHDSVLPKEGKVKAKPLR